MPVTTAARFEVSVMNKDEVLRRAQDKAPNKMDEMELVTVQIPL